MKLYHGTSERSAGIALAKGLHPRRKSKVKSVWAKAVSCRDAVYLTNSYALYFALNAVEDNSSDRAAILEIDTTLLDENLFAPDEDTMEQQGRERDDLPRSWDMLKRTRWYRDHLKDFTGAGQWKASLQLLGNCTYLGDIPASAITRVAYVCPQRAPTTCIQAMDAMITLPNYRFCGSKYRGLTKWIFNEDVGNDAPVSYGDIPGFGTRWSYELPPESERMGIDLIVPRHLERV